MNINELLLVAIKENNSEAVKFLLKQGADVNAKDENGRAAFDLATDDIVKSILSAAQGNAADSADVPQTPTHHENLGKLFLRAVIKNDIKVIDSFLTLGVNIRFQDKYGWTALMIACSYGHKEIVEMLLGHNPGVDLKTKLGCSALMIASSYGHKEIVAMLLGQNPDVELQDRDGWTALMVASNYGHKEVVQMLLAHGADIHVQNKFGENALDLADYRVVKEILQKAAWVNKTSQGVETANSPGI